MKKVLRSIATTTIICTYCNQPTGCDYEVAPLKGELVTEKRMGQGGTTNA